MSILLDTHALVWWLLASPQLSQRARSEIDNGEQRRIVSVVSAFEMATKVRIGKWEAARPIVDRFEQICREANFEVLPLGLDHTLLAARFAGEHRDPFDRLLAAQALRESSAVVTLDPAFQQFGVQVLW